MENVNSAWLTCQAGVAVCVWYLRVNLRAEATGAPGPAGWRGVAATGLDARRCGARGAGPQGHGWRGGDAPVRTEGGKGAAPGPDGQDAELLNYEY